ncbi:MAG: hypothetical protein U9N44_02195 [Chloroflexota bacterium]|nr:hypothetical protein [Chloroflexota bacterium]
MIFHLAVYIVCAAVLAVVFALFEIQIEGKDGWATKLPCWRKRDGLIVKLSGGRPITGYHIVMVTFVILIFHFPFLFAEWTLATEFLILGLLFETFLLEDFFWFVFNPYFGLKKFKKGEIWWHTQWWGPLPSLYYYMISVCVLLLVLSQLID